MKKTLLLLLLLWTTITGAYAQTSNSVSLQGKANSSIYNTDLYTGTTTVNIPLYSYTVDGLDLGVSLSYNTLGIKVDQIASSVGLGWNLNAGGSITRVVHGIEDDIQIPDTGHLDNNGNYFSTHAPESGAWLQSPTNGATEDLEFDDFTASFAGRTVNFSIRFGDTILNVLKDTIGWIKKNSPDYLSPYTVVTNPHSGITIDLMLNYSSTEIPLLGTNSDHTIQTVYNAGTDNSTFLGFIITDEQGNRFYFERADYEENNIVSAVVGAPSYNIVYKTDRWALAQVITSTGQVINYTNVLCHPAYPLAQNQSVKETSNYQSYYTGVPVWTGGDMSVLNNDTLNWLGAAMYTTKIEYPNGVTANFYYNSSRCDAAAAPKLDSVVIESKYDNNVGNTYRYVFNYEYFHTPNTYNNNPSIAFSPCSDIADTYSGLAHLTAVEYLEYSLRLKLLGITKIGNDRSTSEPYYSFEYNTTPLPSRLSPAQDYYGYSNGATISDPIVSLNGDNAPTSQYTVDLKKTLYNLSIPRHTFSYTKSGSLAVTYGISKLSNITQAQAGILTAFTNGAGGRTELYYVSHLLSNPDLSVANTNGYYKPYDLVSPYVAPSDLDADLLNSSDGVCIHEIRVRDGANTDNDVYTDFGYDGGISFFATNYLWYPTLFSGGYSAGNSNMNEQNTIHEKVWSNGFVSPISDINGAYHGYSSVSTITYGHADNVKQTNQTFTNLISVAGEVDGDPGNVSRIMHRNSIFKHTTPPDHFNKYMMGLPVETDMYDKNGTLLSQTINTYNDKEYLIAGGLRQAMTSTSPANYFQSAYNFNLAYVNTSFVPPQDYVTMPDAIALLVRDTVRNYFGTQHSQTIHSYQYDMHNNLTSTTWTNSKGDACEKDNLYDIQSFSHAYLSFSHSENFILQHPIGSVLSVAGIRNSAVQNNFIYTSGNIPNVPSSQNYSSYHGILFNNAVSSFQASTVYTGITGTGYLYPIKNYVAHDSRNDVTETGYNNSTSFESAIWDTRIGQKVAQVTNAHFPDIAYTSFEGAPDGNDEIYGNWDFDTLNILYQPSSPKAMTGKYCYNLVSGGDISCQNLLNTSKEYLLSFWAYGAVPLVYNGFLSTPITMTAMSTVNGWTLYTAYFTPLGTYPVLLRYNAAPTLVDELRLHPSDAGMVTNTYEPLWGISSSCDERNNITYYEYDAMGRPTVTRDINGNILSLTKHVVQGTDN